MKCLVLFSFVIFVSTSFAQKLDYLKMKDTICPPICGWRDSLSLTEIRSGMLALDTNRLTNESLSYYFDDLAGIEYELFAYTLDSNLIENSAWHNVRATAYDPESYFVYWNAAFAYGMLRECEKMKYYLTLFKEKCPRKYMDKEQKKQIVYLEQKCQ
jgi:hypothetical protein